MPARILHPVSGFVGELAEVHLRGVTRLREHVDVRSRAKHAALPARHHDDVNRRVLEANPLQRIVQFDVDAEIVRIQLQLVSRTQPACLVDVHHQRGDRAVDLQLPVTVSRRIGPEVDRRFCWRSSRFAHRLLVRKRGY